MNREAEILLKNISKQLQEIIKIMNENKKTIEKFDKDEAAIPENCVKYRGKIVNEYFLKKNKDLVDRFIDDSNCSKTKTSIE